MKINFTPIEEQLPEKGKKVLIQYIKGYSPTRRGAEKGTYITQGYLIDDAERAATERNPIEFWRDSCGYGLCWYDYSDRQIEALRAKASKNKVIGWIYLD